VEGIDVAEWITGAWQNALSACNGRIVSGLMTEVAAC
jgi:hypothetical protein